MSRPVPSFHHFAASRSVVKNKQERLWILLFSMASAIFLFADAKTPPIALQDEARNSINAIEMYFQGFGLVTTFEFQPDLWNTKPPLMIWLMQASMIVLGPSEWAIRLPSALSAIGLLSTTLIFVRRVTGSLSLAMVTALILLLSPGFFGEHGARTGDFDAPLTFFVTVGLQLIFFAVHRARPCLRSMIAIGGLVAAGALTKSIAAFIPLAGTLLYLVTVGRLRRVLSQSRRYALAGIVAVAPLLAFYAAREAAGPGYLSAVIHNDVFGRFSDTLIRPTSPFYYVTELTFGWFVAGPFLVAGPVALASFSPRERLLFGYAASIAAACLFVYSAATNRAVQYALPMLPWLSIMAALTLRYLVGFVTTTWRNDRRAQAVILGGLLLAIGGQLTARAADWRFHRFPARQFYPQSSYGDLFADLSTRGVRTLTVVDPGIVHLGRPGYTPLLRWHRLVWEARGMQIHHALAPSVGLRAPIASCEPRVFEQWTGLAFEKVGSCAVLWRS